MIRYLKSVRRDTQSVAEVVGIILMLTIVMLTATALHVSMGQTGNDKLKMIPVVSMKQDDDHILITKIQYGPIHKDDVTFKVYDSSESFSCEGALSSAGIVASGDTITIPCVNPGEKYTVWMIYMNSQVGVVEFNKP